MKQISGKERLGLSNSIDGRSCGCIGATKSMARPGSIVRLVHANRPLKQGLLRHLMMKQAGLLEGDV